MSNISDKLRQLQKDRAGSQSPPETAPKATVLGKQGDRPEIDDPTAAQLRRAMGSDAAAPTPDTPTPPATPEPAAPTEHKVVSGDNLSAIALKYYGSANRWKDIYEANKQTIGDNPSAIRVGMVLKLPQ